MTTILNGPKVTKCQVVKLLRKHGVDYSKWGEAPSYTLDDLLKRLREEQVYLVEEKEMLILKINVGNILPYIEDFDTGDIFELYEERQVHNGGVIVQRPHLRGVTGILLRDERPEDGAKREMVEELGQTEPKLRTYPIATTHWEDGTLTRNGPSRKWPGLKCVTNSVGFKFRMPPGLCHRQYIEVTSNPDTHEILRTSIFEWRIWQG